MFIIAFSAVLVALLWFGVERTRWGAMVRAAVDNRAMAQSVGIDTKRLFTLTFALGSGLAGLGGALGAEIIAIQPTYPFENLVYFLVVVAVGGLGSLRGPFVAALLIGIADTACKYWLPQFGAFLDLRRDHRDPAVAARGTLRKARMSAHAGGYSADPRIRPGSSGCRGWSRSPPSSRCPEYLSLGARILIYILFALSLDLILGYAGIVTLGHSAFFGLGAYVAGILAAKAGITDPLIQLGGGGCRRGPARPRRPARSSCAPGA